MNSRTRVCVLTVCLLPLWSPGASAAVITVGPDGSTTDIDAAIESAISQAGDDEVRIQSGVHAQRIAISATTPDRTDISGGWNSAFDQQTSNPALTEIDGDLLGRTFDLTITDGILTLRNLSFTRGQHQQVSTVKLDAYNDAQVELTDCRVHHGVSQGVPDAVGTNGALGLGATSTAQVTVERCRIDNNRSENPNEFFNGAGVYAGAIGSASVLRLRELEVLDNQIIGELGVGAGLFLVAGEQSQVEILDSTFTGNSVTDMGSGQSTGSGVTMNVATPGSTALIEFRRNLVTLNTVLTLPNACQMQIFLGADSRIVVGDSEITAAPTRGLCSFRADTSVLQLVNLTLADNEGLDLVSSFGADLSNTLADATTNSPPGTGSIVNSLLNADPGYIDRGAGNYRLPLSSPAIGAGTLTPAGGLGMLDLDGNPRVRGFGVDLGAYEADDPTLFRNGFE